eukprot:UN23223
MTIEQITQKIRSLVGTPSAVLIGCETGVECGEELATHFGLLGNDGAKSYVRRNKFHQQEAARKAGVNAASQLLAKNMDDVGKFLSTITCEPFAAIVKPPEGAGTVGVMKCDSPDEVKSAVEDTLSQCNVFGLENEGALLMEF